MNWTELLQQILEICIIPLLGVLTTFLIGYIKEKKDALICETDNANKQKYIELLANIITDCVRATNQTYVEALKKENAFTPEAQKEAFARTYKAIFEIIDQNMLEMLTYIYGDVETYIRQKIESAVNWEKFE